MGGRSRDVVLLSLADCGFILDCGLVPRRVSDEFSVVSQVLEILYGLWLVPAEFYTKESPNDDKVRKDGAVEPSLFVLFSPSK